MWCVFYLQSLPFLFRESFVVADLLDDVTHVSAESVFQFRRRCFRVFERVMQNGRD
jgi:hypothetical protein